MKTQIITIVLTGGGSGGHITPLLSLARELKELEPSCHIVYIGLKGDKLEDLQTDYQVFDQVCVVPAGKFRRYHGESFLAHLVDVKSIALNVRDFFRLWQGTFAARRLLKKIKPDVVFSKGGYVAVPVGIAAHWQRIPIITHDSDSLPGLANRIIGRWAYVHATGMPAEYYNYPKDTIRYTGIPISTNFKSVNSSAQTEYKRQLGLPGDSLALLVSGGGLGSKNINELVVAVAPHLMQSFPKLYILHITGTSHQAVVKSQYQSALRPEDQKRAKVLGFTDKLHLYIGSADLVITRAGATTLAELAAMGKACVIIPSPFLSGGHQLKNAEMLQKSSAAEILPNDVKPDELLLLVNELLADKAKRAGLAKKMSALAQPEAAKRLAKIILETAGQGTAA